MSFFDGEKKEMRKFNWLDWALLVLVAASIAGGFLLVRRLSGDSAGEEGVVVYTVLVSSLDAQNYDAAELFEIGSHVRSQNGTMLLGEVGDVQRLPHKRTVVKNGKIVFMEEEGVSDYRITVRSVGRRKDGDGIRVGDIRIAAGMQLTLRVGDFLVPNGRVIAVSWEEVT